MSNIFNHNREIFQISLNKDNYWDFHLATDYRNGDSLYNGLTTHCLSSFIDTDNPNCVWFNKLYSDENYKWEKAINNGAVLSSVGYTAVDNGIIQFEKDSTSNKKFLELYTKSVISIPKDDLRFVAEKVSGNNQLYDYTNNIIEKDGMIVSELNGGFYQGFFKTKCNEYQVLPDNIDDGLTIELVLNKSDLTNEKITLNKTHENNKGFFFYIGTRAENKWWKYYKVSTEFNKNCNSYNNNDYFNKDYININYYSTSYINDDNFGKPCCEYYNEQNSALSTDYVNYDVNEFLTVGAYLEEDESIENDMQFNTEEGYSLYQPNITEITTDNKFITFNRTKEGFDINSEEQDNKIILYNIEVPEIENYFTLFNRTNEGYTTNNINSYILDKSKKYNVIADITNNALGFRITDDGKIGYRYLISDCNSESKYSIIEEYTEENVIKNDEWICVSVKIDKIGQSKMQLSFYVNSKLKLVSKELEALSLRALNDLYSKQEGVPYNISIGGGTQGLCDVIYHKFRDLPNYRLPLEQNFAGSFIGYLKEFRLYSCSLTMNDIKSNMQYSFRNL